MPGLGGHVDAPLCQAVLILGRPSVSMLCGQCMVSSLRAQPALGHCAGGWDTGRHMSATLMDQTLWVCGPRLAQAG